MINKVLNEPVYDDDAVNKKYVDDLIDKIQENIIPVELNENSVYSTEEIIVGTWVDNKPIYRKVYFFDCKSINYTAVYKGHGINDLETIITQKCNWLDGSGSVNRWRAIPANYYATLNWATQLTVDMYNITFELGDSAYSRIRDQGKQLYVILEYTKATD
jgi:hypothetical protein